MRDKAFGIAKANFFAAASRSIITAVITNLNLSKGNGTAEIE
jgi:hypothetical protein